MHEMGIKRRVVLVATSENVAAARCFAHKQQTGNRNMTAASMYKARVTKVENLRARADIILDGDAIATQLTTMFRANLHNQIHVPGDLLTEACAVPELKHKTCSLFTDPDESATAPRGPPSRQ